MALSRSTTTSLNTPFAAPTSTASALFSDVDAKAGNRAVIASHTGLSASLTAIVQGHKHSQTDDLPPCNGAIKV